MSGQLETKEAGTGKWFPIIIYTPGTANQLAQARSAAEMLRAISLYAIVTGFEIDAAALSQEGTETDQ